MPRDLHVRPEDQARRVKELMKVTHKPADAIGFVYGKRRTDIELPSKPRLERDALLAMMEGKK